MRSYTTYIITDVYPRPCDPQVYIFGVLWRFYFEFKFLTLWLISRGYRMHTNGKRKRQGRNAKHLFFPLRPKVH